MKVCVITDNEYIYANFRKLIIDSKHEFSFFFSVMNKQFMDKYASDLNFSPINLKNADEGFLNRYDVFFSLHCKQLFPARMVKEHRCINVHPGLNPYNRGWYPQVFSIINGKPVGVTIHEMDEQLDHGPIIYQDKIEIESFDTSYDVYQRILKLEISMLSERLEQLVTGEYEKRNMVEEGNINYKSDFNDLCRMDLNKKGTFREFVNILRATTFDKYDNAYFIDDAGNRVYVSINLKKEDNKQ